MPASVKVVSVRLEDIDIQLMDKLIWYQAGMSEVEQLSRPMFIRQALREKILRDMESLGWGCDRSKAPTDESSESKTIH